MKARHRVGRAIIKASPLILAAALYWFGCQRQTEWEAYATSLPLSEVDTAILVSATPTVLQILALVLVVGWLCGQMGIRYLRNNHRL